MPRKLWVRLTTSERWRRAGLYQPVPSRPAGKTVTMIAHGLSTTRHCDAIYLHDQGRLVSQGSYETLLLDSDRFRAMAGTR